ncbi:hypothetical protein BJ742DRAFT_780752 [Cladochytrium replicatum]|nr:hypothetical protein BJ742DRAFT_780752 [Cladochytrium replicatum]
MLDLVEAAREALTDMPPRLESELDPVTLHNVALMNMDGDPSAGFEKLNVLLRQHNDFESWGFEYFDLAADLLAEYSAIAGSTLNPDSSTRLSSKPHPPKSLTRNSTNLASKHVDHLRKLTKAVQEARTSAATATSAPLSSSEDPDVLIKSLINDYDHAVEHRCIPVLMAQAPIYCEMENHPMVEKIFRKSVEFCNELEVWKLNVTHVLFMQENKYKEAISFYEPIVNKHYGNVLDVTAIVLANLCVSYILTSQNDEAEELMRKIEKGYNESFKYALSNQYNVISRIREFRFILRTDSSAISLHEQPSFSHHQPPYFLPMPHLHRR